MADLHSGFDLMGQLLDVYTLRQRVITHNIANESTPGYLRKDVSFEEQFAKALKRGDKSRLKGVEAEVFNPEGGTFKPNGNNVTFEEEYALSVKNQIIFDVVSSALKGRFRSLEEAISIR